MAKLSKKKTLFLALLLLLLLLSFAAVGYFMLTHSYRKVEYFTLALQAYQDGDLEKAKALAVKEINQDPNNEQAIVTLAGWLDREGVFLDAGMLWLRAANLNALQTQYVHNARASLFLSRNFEQHYLTCSSNTRVPLLQTEKLQHAYSAFSLAKINEADNILQSITDEAVLESPLGQLLAVFLPLREPRDQDDEEQRIRAFLPTLTDQFVRYECLLLLHFYALQKQDGDAVAEKLLLEAVALNPRHGLPVLGNYYYRRNRFAEAADIYQKALPLRPNDVTVRAWAAESLLLSQQYTALQQLIKEFKPEGREKLLCAYYLEALQAYLERDGSKLSQALLRTNRRFRSPMAAVLSLGANIYTGNHREVVRIANELAVDTRLKEFRARGDQLLLPYLSQLMQEERSADAAELARVMQQNRRPELLFLRLDIQDKFQLGTLQRHEITAALESFPDDLQLLYYSCRLFLRMGDYKQALQEARRLQTLQPDSLEAGMLVIAALDAVLDFAAAEAEFMKYRRKYPQNMTLLNNYWNFCSNLKRLDCLQRLWQDIEQQGYPEQQEYIPVIKAELAFLSNAFPQVVELLQSFRSGNPEVLYHAAYTLARSGSHAPAIALYKQIPAQFSRYELVQLNLSELLAEEGEGEAALQVARQAWLKNPDSLLTRECYGLRLHETGAAEQALDILNPLLLEQRSNTRVAEAWRQSMYRHLQALFADGEFQHCYEHAQRLRLYFPDDARGEDFLHRSKSEIEKAQEQANAGAAQPAEKKP